MPRVTALRELRRGRVAVEVDGSPWRTLPATVVAAAGLRRDAELDRPRLRLLRTELRRAEALVVAGRALRHRDHSRASLDARLAAADVRPTTRSEALAALERAGLVDDRRAAAARAEALAARGYGDEAIRVDLERRGFEGHAAASALASLQREEERARAVVGRRGPSAATTRRLLSRGFSPETVDAVLPDVAADEAGAVG